MFSLVRAAEDIPCGAPVYVSGNFKVSKAQAVSSHTACVIGVSASAVKMGQRVLIVRKGLVFHALKEAEAGDTCYLQLMGGVAVNRPSPKSHIVRVGYALESSGSLYVCLQEYKFLGGFQG